MIWSLLKYRSMFMFLLFTQFLRARCIKDKNGPYGIHFKPIVLILLVIDVSNQMWLWNSHHCHFNWTPSTGTWKMTYTCICNAIGDPIIKRGRFRIPLFDITLTHICACPKQGPAFPMTYVVVFFFRWNVICSCCLYWCNYWPSLFKLLFIIKVDTTNPL